MIVLINGVCLWGQGLVAAGENPKKSPAIRKAVTFLLQHQNKNGGWGESYLSCVDKAYPPDGTGSEHGGLSGSMWFGAAKEKMTFGSGGVVAGVANSSGSAPVMGSVF